MALDVWGQFMDIHGMNEEIPDWSQNDTIVASTHFKAVGVDRVQCPAESFPVWNKLVRCDYWVRSCYQINTTFDHHA